MKEVYKNLYVGNQSDFEDNKTFFNKWKVVHACKYPYHRDTVGYTGASAPKGPNYYFVYDSKGHLSLNMIDVESSTFFQDIMIDEAIRYCVDALTNNTPVLVHCNQGESRAPILAMMVLKKMGIYKCTFAEAFVLFRNVYPNLNPKKGIFEYAMNRWTSL